ncbi:MAG: hypothetical protein V4572_09130 [Bacteroidota bacterium]
MNKIELLYGFVIGILASLIGSYIFVTWFTHFDFITGVSIMKSEGKLGKLITLGSILDLIAFAVLLRFNKELMARGVILAVIVIAFITLFA